MNQRGISSLAVIISGAILSILVLMITGWFADLSQWQKRFESRDRTELMLNHVSKELYGLSQAELLSLCQARGPVASTPLSTASAAYDGPCLNAAGQLAEAAGAGPLDKRRQWNGELSPTGPACVEMRRCALLASTALLEVELVAFWTDPAPSSPVRTTAPMIFRKSQW